MAAIFSALATVSNLLSNVFAVDVVAIFQSDSFDQVFTDARPIKAEVKETSLVMRHPVETGAMIADNHIINPVEINMSLIAVGANLNSVYGQMKQAFVAATSLSVQTRTGVYPNMIISDMPHIEDAEIYNGVIISLRLIEVLYVVPTSVSPLALPANFSPKDPVNSNTVQAGLKYPTDISASTSSAAQAALSLPGSM